MIYGTYRTACEEIPLSTGSVYQQNQIDLTQSTMTLLVTTYVAKDCADSSKITVATFSYDAVSDLASRDVAKNLEIRPTPIKRTLKEVSVTVYTDGIVNIYNEKSNYGYSDWKAGEKKNVAEKTGPSGSKAPALETVSYIFLGIKDNSLTQSAEGADASTIEYRAYNDSYKKI